MRIIHVEDYFDPEAGYQINELLRANKYFEDEVILITSTDMTPFHKKLDIQKDKKFEQETGIKIIRLKPIFKYSSRLILPNLFKIINENQPDLLYLHGIGDFKDLILLSKEKKMTIIRDSHMSWIASKNKLSKLYYILYKNTFARIINKTTKYNKIFALGKEEKEYLLRIGINEEKIEILSHGYNPDIMYYDPTERNTIRDKYKITNDEIVISYIGKFDYNKRPDFIVDILKGLSKEVVENNSLTILFIGSKNKEYIEFFKSRLKELSGKVNIIIDEAKPFTELYKYYSASDICIFPEETTLSSIHAQVCGCPVIMVDYDSNKERVVQNENLFTRNKFEEASKILSKLIENKKDNRNSYIKKYNKALSDRNYKYQVARIRELV